MNRRRTPLIAANWKMHKVRSEARSFCRCLVDELPTVAGPENGPVDVLLFPSFPQLSTVAQELAGSAVDCGGQDVHDQDQGAFTGDVSGAQLADVGCTWALAGHSERRQHHAESDTMIGRKAVAARRHGLRALVCCGESQEERRAGDTFEVLGRQVGAVIDALAAAGDGQERSPDDDGPGWDLAYEPVWAIGTGETATPEIAQEAHAFLRGLIAERLGQDRARAIRILYGGSAKPDNVASLIVEQDIDGFLIGGAGLDSQKFLAMIGVCAGSA